jgi:type IV secretion system protein VirB10
MSVRSWIALVFLARLAAAQNVAQDAVPAQPSGPQRAEFTIDPGTRVPLSLINAISTKHSAVGDRLYLETAFPILANGRIVIPVGSYVAGTVTQVKRPGRVKGRGEIYVRFDSLTLPNGVTRDFHARMGGMDATSPGQVDEKEGKVTGDGDKAGDVRTVAETTAAGTSIGAIAGSSTGHLGMGMGIGAGAGAAAGLIGVLATRGPDTILARGSTLEMVLDRPLVFQAGELDFGNYQPPRGIPAAPPPANKSTSPLRGPIPYEM